LLTKIYETSLDNKHLGLMEIKHALQNTRRDTNSDS